MLDRLRRSFFVGVAASAVMTLFFKVLEANLFGIAETSFPTVFAAIIVAVLMVFLIGQDLPAFYSDKQEKAVVAFLIRALGFAGGLVIGMLLTALVWVIVVPI